MEKFYVCYFDVLGQKDVLKNVNRHSFSFPKDTRFKCSVMIETSKCFIDALNNVIATWCNENKDWNGIAGVYQFSDSFIVYVEDKENSKKLFKKILIKVSYLYWVALGRELPIRGLIVHGSARYMEGGSLWGPIFCSFENLEKYCAEYSRLIFVGNDWNDFADIYVNIDGWNMLNVCNIHDRKDEEEDAAQVGIGYRCLLEGMREFKGNQDVLKKKFKLLLSLRKSKIANTLDSNNGSLLHIDSLMFNHSDPYPRLKPDDYCAIYLKVNKILDGDSQCFSGFSKNDNSDTRVFNDIKAIVGNVNSVIKKLHKDSERIYSECLDKNRVLLTKERFCAEVVNVGVCVQQINNDVLICVKDDSQLSMFVAAYVVSEISELATNFLNDGIFISGAVCYGNAWENNDGIYGPVIQEAYSQLKNDDSLRISLSSEMCEAVDGNAICARYLGDAQLFVKSPIDGTMETILPSDKMKLDDEENVELFSGIVVREPVGKQQLSNLGLATRGIRKFLGAIKASDICDLHNWKIINNLNQFIYKYGRCL